MSRRYYLSILLLFPFLLAICQDTTLQRLLATENSRFKIDQLQAYAQSLLDKDNHKANDIYKITLEGSAQLKYDLGTATAWRKVGYINGQEGNYKEAINCFQTAIFYYTKTDGYLKDIL